MLPGSSQQAECEGLVGVSRCSCDRHTRLPPFLDIFQKALMTFKGPISISRRETVMTRNFSWLSFGPESQTLRGE